MVTTMVEAPGANEAMLDTLICKIHKRLGVSPDSSLDPGRAFLRETAHHEAGHVIAKLSLGDRMGIHWVSIDHEVIARELGEKAAGRRWGVTRIGVSRMANAFDDAVYMLAGPIAQDMYTRSSGSSVISARRKCARSQLGEWRQARERIAHEPCLAWRTVVSDAEELVRENWSKVTAVADGLLTKGTLTGEQVQAIIDG